VVTSAHYTRDYNEVKRLGAFASTDRTAEQTDLAFFYTDNFLAPLEDNEGHHRWDD